ncbi:hypothetical protein IEQ34_022628 [Dendrobium chrysotoxum]|uniref:Uncharacterized protein n=1 Tax=Dendrobium chrysotoxum TaxID=161865 RepID=A0AAV7FZE6_DENCH|nr:hypothetical protein IEQ34_022628 [Dendrobium chrysotoxum]
MLLHKNFHIPNDVVTTVPKRSDRASLPPSGYLTVSEASLRAGLRFPPSAELVEILRRCGVCLSQLSYRAMSVTVGLIALFRDRGAVLTPEHLSRMGRLTSDVYVRVTFRCIWLDMRTRDPAKNWSSSYFFVGLSFHSGRSDARMLKPTSKVLEPPVPVPKAASKRQVGGEDPQVLLKKKKLEGVAANTGKVAPVSSPVKIRLSRRTELVAELTGVLDEWNAEFVKIKYLQGEFKRKYDQKTREAKVLEEELCGCRTELANIVQSISLQNQQIDRLQVDLERAQANITQLREDQRASGERVAVLEAENKRSQTLIAEKEAALTSFESARVIDDFKKSIAFKIIIQDHVQEARDHIYEVEVKALEQQCLDDGFIRGFLKGVRLMHRKTGVEVEGLTPSQASDDFPPGSDGDEIESELQKAFALEADDEVVDIE